MVETLQALSVDLAVSECEGHLEGDQLVDFVMERSCFGVDSVGKSANVVLGRKNLVLRKLGGGAGVLYLGHYDTMRFKMRKRSRYGKVDQGKILLANV